MNLIGRKKEIEILKKCQDSAQSEFVAVYGRRRIGKTYLINNALEPDFDFKFTASYNSKTTKILEEFQIAINRLTGTNVRTPKNWNDALYNLSLYLYSLSKDKVTVFIDELPWMDTHKSDFIYSFSRFVNCWDSNKCLLKLYTCGSSTSWMINTLIGDKGGLHGRTTRQIHLSPFTLKETEDYLKDFKKVNLTRKQILDLYMIVGGIPYYLNMIDFSYPVSKNIDELFFAGDGALRYEYDFLFSSLFNKSVNYGKVINAISKKLYGMTREEILKETGLDGGYLTEILENLKKCDFIRVYACPDKKIKGGIYQLTDLFTLFNLRFVSKFSGQDPDYWTHSVDSGSINAWHGYAYEQVCFIHSEQIKKTLGINGIRSDIYSWKSLPFSDKDGNEFTGGQIDLIIDRADNVMNLCEIKYSDNVYKVSKDYSERLRKRENSFVNSVKTKKAICNTFITVYGITENDISDNDIKLDSLFCD